MSEVTSTEERNPKRKKNRDVSKMGLGFAPYADWRMQKCWQKTHDTRNASCGRGDNATSRFTQWVMRRTVGTFLGFTDDLAIVGDAVTPDQSKEWNIEQANASKEPSEERIQNCSTGPITKEYNRPTE